MELEIKLPAFEGPMDLLLHLIDRDKINIYDIPIVTLTDQYLAYVEHMEKVDLDLMSDFLVMAATLLDIKSRMLLPKPETEEEIEEDPRTELVLRLLEYRKYKYLGTELRELSVGSDRIVFKEADLPEEVLEYKPPVDLDQLLAGVDLARLNRIFNEVMNRREELVDTNRAAFSGTMQREAVTISDRIGFVRKKITKGVKKSFKALLKESKSRTEIIVTFLAILELMKIGEIHLTEEELTDDFTLEGV